MRITKNFKLKIMAMVFSVALPVQFWLSGCDTFNESDKDGLNDACWCQPWNCDEIMPIRFSDDPGQEFFLTVVDGDEILDTGIAIPEVEEGYYSLDLELTEYCNKKIRLLIQGTGEESEFLSADLADPSPFVKVAGAEYPWRIPSFSDAVKERTSPILSNTINNGDQIDINLGLSINNTSTSFTVQVVLMQSFGAATQTIDFGSMTHGVAETESVSATNNYDQVKIVVSDIAFSGAVTTDGTISIFTFSIQRLAGSDISMIDNPGFTGSLSPWTNTGASGTDWTYGTNTATVTNSSPGAFSKNLRESLASEIQAGQQIQINVDFSVAGGGTSILEVGFSDDGSTGWQWFTLTSGVVGGGILSNDANYIAFRQTRTGGVGATLLTINGITDFSYSDPLIMDNAQFTGSLSPWSNQGSGTDWTYSSNAATVSNSSPGAVSKNLRNALTSEIASGSNVQVAVDFVASGSTLEVGFSDDGSTGWQWFTLTPGVAAGGVLSADANYIALRQTRTIVGAGTASVTVDSVSYFSINGVEYSLGIDEDGYEQIDIPNGWTQAGDGLSWSSSNRIGTSIALDRTGFLVRFLSNDSSSVEATGLVMAPDADLNYAIDMTTFTDEVGSISLSWELELFDADDNPVGSVSDSFTSEANTLFSGVVELTGTPVKAVLTATNSGAVQSIRLQVNTMVLGSSVILAKTDCHHIKTSHSETKRINFSNNRNFAGLRYEDISPAEEFMIRVPCVFFHKRFPQEDKAIERTNSTVVTSSKIKTQKLMQVKHAPDYFHEKLIKILTHQNVEIDGVLYKKKEAYEKDEGDPLYPLKKATVYLTQKNSLTRNVL